MPLLAPGAARIDLYEYHRMVRVIVCVRVSVIVRVGVGVRVGVRVRAWSG